LVAVEHGQLRGKEGSRGWERKIFLVEVSPLKTGQRWKNQVVINARGRKRKNQRGHGKKIRDDSLRR